MFRLPDLPNAGYATTREKELSDAIMIFMREIERDRFRLLTIVCNGREKFRDVCREVWNARGIETETIDEMFKYFTIQAAQPRHQVALLQAVKNPELWREIVREAMPDIERQRKGLELMARFGY